MQKLITYLNSLPPIPDDLIQSYDEIRATPSHWDGRTKPTEMDKWSVDGTIPNVTFKELPYRVKNWAEENFPFPIKETGWYIEIYEHVIKHIDYSVLTPHRIGINYLLHPGGENCITHLYDDDRNSIQSIHIEKHRWHKVPIDVLHNVIGITEQPRIMLRIFPKDHVKWEDII